MLTRLKNLRFGKLIKRDAPGSAQPSPPEQGPLPRDPLFHDLDMKSVTIVPREQHCVSRKMISSSALKVLYRLDEEGYQAFLVGGSVRDLLLGNRPKDFDIGTNATPEELRQMFRNARVIGRRFKIVHIRFGREIIEVTTFRAHHDPETVEIFERGQDFRHLDSAHSSSGMILRDNVYGDINEDAARRDFTVNALYYTIRDFRILDFSSGLQDIQKRLIRVIGDPVERFKEDPVRMLRAIRFAAKLDFTIEATSREPMDRLAAALESVAPARLFDETLKLFSAGYGEKTFALLQQFKVGHYLIPDTIRCTQNSDTVEAKLVGLALRNTDKRIAEEKSVTPAFLFAALLWPVLCRELKGSPANESITTEQIAAAADRVIGRQQKHTTIPRRFTSMIREIWELQQRLQKQNSRSASSAYQHPRFRAAYDFLILRMEAGEQLDNLGEWWTSFQLVDETRQQAMLDSLGTAKRRRRKPRRRRSGGQE